MKNHSLLFIRSLEPTLVIKMIETTLLGLLTENENKGSCCNALKDLITNIYSYRNKLKSNIEALLNVEGTIFMQILKTLLTTVIYEEHKIIWVFQKPLFPTIVINGKENYEAVKQEILQNEPNDELRSKIQEELNLL